MEFVGWIKWGMGSRGKPGGHSDEFTRLLLDENELYEDESPLVPVRIERDFWAIGSGSRSSAPPAPARAPS